MSTSSGLASKADKEKGSKPKFSSLNINHIFKDKSSENTKTVEPVKHGLQTLGKIGAGRRVPPPANLPSLKSETNKTTSSNVSSTVNTSTTSNTTTTSGISQQQQQQGWAKKDQEDIISSIQLTDSNNSTQSIEQQQQQQNSNFLTSETANGQLTDSNNSIQSNVNVNTSQSKTWNSVTEQQQTVETSPKKSTTAAVINTTPPSNNNNLSFFSQDFPTLDGGNNVTNVQKSNSENYGPGQNSLPQHQQLRPQTGNWINNNTQNQQQNSGNYVNGQLQQDDLDRDTQQSRAYNTAHQHPSRNNNNKSNGYNQSRQNYQNYPQRYNNQNNNNVQYNQSQQYQPNQRQYDNRNQQRIREDMPERAKVAILSEKELQGFDELLDDSKLEDWTKTKTQIDFNAKLNFSEDEDARSLNEFDDQNLREDKSTTNENTNQDKMKPTKSSQINEHSRYRRDYQNPRPHQSYNSNTSNKYERNSNYQPAQQSIKKMDDDDDKRIKLKSSDLNESKRRREDEDRKYNQQQKEKIDQVQQQQSTNYNKSSSNRNQDEMLSSQPPLQSQQQSAHNSSNNYSSNSNPGIMHSNNNRQFQQSLPPRFQKLQQNTNQSSYNRFDSNANNRNQQSNDKIDRKQRTESQGSQDDYQNKRAINKQTNWRNNNRELSKSQEKPYQPISNEEKVKNDQPIVEKSTSNDQPEQIKQQQNEIETSSNKVIVELDLKSSTNSNQLLNSSSNSGSLIKKMDDDDEKPMIKDVVAGDSLSNDLASNLAKNISQLSISEKNTTITTTKLSSVSTDSKNVHHLSKCLDKTMSKDEMQTKIATEKQSSSGKSLSASQESKHSQHSELNKYDQQQQHSYKNQRGSYDNRREDRTHYRQDDYRMYNQRDYRNNRQNSMDNRVNEKMRVVDKNMNKKHEYDDYRSNRDYNQINRPIKYEQKKDDKYSKINQQQQQQISSHHSAQKDNQSQQQKSIGNKSSSGYSDKPTSNRRENERNQESLNKSSNDKELNSSQNDKSFDNNKKQPPLNQQRVNKDRKLDQALDESASSGFLSNKKQMKYGSNIKPSTNQHPEDLTTDKNKVQREKPQSQPQQPHQKISNYERKNEHSTIRNQRKLSHDEVEKVIKAQEDEIKKSKEIEDKTKASLKTEMLQSKPLKLTNNNTRSKQSNNPASNRYYKDNYNNKNFDYYYPMDDQYNNNRPKRNNSNSKFGYKEDIASSRSSIGNKSHNLLTKHGLIINSNFNKGSASKICLKNDRNDQKNENKNESKNDLSKQNKQQDSQSAINNQNNSKKSQSVSKSNENSNTNSNSTNNNNKQIILSGSSKSSSFDQQDSGIDLSDQLASNASSQRSSPSSNTGKANNNNSSVVSISCVSTSTKTTNGVNNNLLNATSNKHSVKPTELTSSSNNKKLAVDELDNSKAVCNVIFDNNSKLKATDNALDKFSNKLGIKDSNKSELDSISSLHYSDKNDNSADNTKIDFSFNSNKASAVNVSKVVGASRNMVGDQSQISPSTDDLNLKIASVKNVWEMMPSMPSVLEINNEDTNQLDHKYDETKLRSPMRSNVVDQTNAVHVLSTINSSNNGNNSSSFAFANINMKQISNDDLKKSHQQLYQQHTAANQIQSNIQSNLQSNIHQSLSQHPVLISSSPPNLMNHMNNPNLDNVRRVQNQYQLSNMQRISSPSNLIYNSQAQVAPAGVPHQNAASAANVNIYQQFANHMKNMPQNTQLMPQFANHFATTQHILQQRNQVIAPQPQSMPQFAQMQQVAPPSLSGPNPMNNPPQLTNAPNSNQMQTGPPPQNMHQFVQPGQVNLHQQNHLASHLIKQHVVQAPNAFYQNQTVPQQSQIQPGLNTFYQNIAPNAQKPTPYGPPHQQIQHHLGQQIAPQVAPQQFNYHMQPSQQFNLMNPQNNQLAANAQNYRNPKRFI